MRDLPGDLNAAFSRLRRSPDVTLAAIGALSLWMRAFGGDPGVVALRAE